LHKLTNVCHTRKTSVLEMTGIFYILSFYGLVHLSKFEFFRIKVQNNSLAHSHQAERHVFRLNSKAVAATKPMSSPCVGLI
jgi:hypothetical protein